MFYYSFSRWSSWNLFQIFCITNLHNWWERHILIYFRSSTSLMMIWKRTINILYSACLALKFETPLYSIFVSLVVNSKSLNPSHGHCERLPNGFLLNHAFFLCTLLTLDKLLIYMNNAKAFTYGCFFSQ